MADVVYIALASLVVVVALHVSVFLVTRFIQPPKPKVVYLPAPQQPQQPIQALPVQTQPPAQIPPTVTLPTYDAPPKAAPPALPSLPPPIETRESRQTPSAN